MNYYFLPGTGLYGGIKVGYQFADLLNALDAPCIVVTPDGKAPDWFRASSPTIGESEARTRVVTGDNLIFSLPHDYERLLTLPGRCVFHCQGTDPLIDPIIADPNVTLLTCWPQAAAYVFENTARVSIAVGISIADVFYYYGIPKQPGRVAYMPRRGSDLAVSVQAVNPKLCFMPINGCSEQEVAKTLRRCEYYLATAVNEWFGLPALEAMAAGCVVVSVPTVGGMDYLRDRINCRVAEPAMLPDVMSEISNPKAWSERARLRDHGVQTANGYRTSKQLHTLARLLKSELSFLCS